MPSVIRKMKNVVKNFSIPEVKVREATSNDSAFPSAGQLDELARYTYQSKSREEILRILYKRINDCTKNWRHIYKSLVVMEYLSFHGHENVYRALRSMLPILHALKSFIMIDEEGQDKGHYIRERSIRMVKLAEDSSFYGAEKEKATSARSKLHDSSRSKHHNQLSLDQPTKPRSRSTTNVIDSRSTHHVRPDYAPKTREEEDLQLQLALAISKEEAMSVMQPATNPSSLTTVNNTRSADALDVFGMNNEPSIQITDQFNNSNQNNNDLDVFGDVFGTQPQPISASTDNIFGNQSAALVPVNNNFWMTPNPTNNEQQSQLVLHNSNALQPFPPPQINDAFALQPTPEPFGASSSALAVIPSTTNQLSTQQSQNFDAFLSAPSPFDTSSEDKSPKMPKATEAISASNAPAAVEEAPLGDAFQFVQNSGLVELDALANFGSEDKSYLVKQQQQAPSLKQLNNNDNINVNTGSNVFGDNNSFAPQNNYMNQPPNYNGNFSSQNYPPSSYGNSGQYFAQNNPQFNNAQPPPYFNYGGNNQNNQNNFNVQPNSSVQQPQPGTFGYNSSQQPQNRNNPFAD